MNKIMLIYILYAPVNDWLRTHVVQIFDAKSTLKNPTDSMSTMIIDLMLTLLFVQNLKYEKQN